MPSGNISGEYDLLFVRMVSILTALVCYSSCLTILALLLEHGSDRAYDSHHSDGNCSQAMQKHGYIKNRIYQ